MNDELTETKRRAEFEFWSDWLTRPGIGDHTRYYEHFMMNMGGIEDRAFFDDLICVDIGCGPMGSMTWLRNAKAAIGLDPLAEEYMEFGIEKHDMLYLKASAEQMPFPDAYIDVIFSMNSLDHVDDLFKACAEIRRVLRHGGHFIASLNLHEPATPTEPWTLTEELLEGRLFHGWSREFYRIRPKVEDGGDPYRFFFEDAPDNLNVGAKALWCRFRKPVD